MDEQFVCNVFHACVIVFHFLHLVLYFILSHMKYFVTSFWKVRYKQSLLYYYYIINAPVRNEYKYLHVCSVFLHNNYMQVKKIM